MDPTTQDVAAGTGDDTDDTGTVPDASAPNPTAWDDFTAPLGTELKNSWDDLVAAFSGTNPFFWAPLSDELQGTQADAGAVGTGAINAIKDKLPDLPKIPTIPWGTIAFWGVVIVVGGVFVWQASKGFGEGLAAKA